MIGHAFFGFQSPAFCTAQAGRATCQAGQIIWISANDIRARHGHEFARHKI